MDIENNAVVLQLLFSVLIKTRRVVLSKKKKKELDIMPQWTEGVLGRSTDASYTGYELVLIL